MNRELNIYEKEFEKMGFKIDDTLPECEGHCSQMMWNKDGQPECVICTGNDLVILTVEI